MNRVVKTIFDYRLLSIELNLVEDYFRILYRGDLDILFFGLPPFGVSNKRCAGTLRGGGVCVLKREQAGDGVINRRPIVGPPVADNTGNHV